MSEEQIKSMFEKFSNKFEETIFTLIAKFNEIADGFSRVQEGLDFLGKIRIQTAENKQIMSNVEKSFKTLERKLRDMSADGFQLPEGKIIAKATVEEADDFSALLSAPASPAKSSEGDDLSDLGTISELPSLDEIKKKEEPTPAPKPAPMPAFVPEPSPRIEPTPEPAPAPKPEPMPAPKPEPMSAPKLEPMPASEPTPAPAPEPTLTPVPKFEAKSSLSPTPKKPLSVSEPVMPNPKNAEIGLNPMGLTPTPVPKAGVTPAPKLDPKPALTPTPKKPAVIPPPFQNSTPIIEKTAPTSQPTTTESTQRIQNINGIQDIWHNLTIDIKESQNYENIAMSLGLANEYLKQFIKFHKVLFEILKVASEYRRKGQAEAVSKEEKEHLLKLIEGWKFQLR